MTTNTTSGSAGTTAGITPSGTAGSTTGTTTQVYRVYIRATAAAIWDALVRPEWTQRYGYGGRSEYDLRPGGVFRVLASAPMKAAGAPGGLEIPDVIIDGTVLEVDPPRRLVTTWRMLMDPHVAAEGFTRLTYEIADAGPGVCRLTATHELDAAPKLASIVGGAFEDQGGGGGHAWMLSDLKTLLETGSGFAG